MSLDERFTWLLIGCAIGFVAGYAVRYLRDIKEELDEVKTIVEKNRNEGGFARIPVVTDVALLAVVLLTVWAAFASQRASNDIQDTQDRLTKLSVCNQQYLSETVKALNERTAYTQEQADANVTLQKSQAEFIDLILKQPPASELRQERALKQYFDSLTEFVTLSSKAVQKAEIYPYPTSSDLADCFNPK